MFAQSPYNLNHMAATPEQMDGFAERRQARDSSAQDFILNTLAGQGTGRLNQNTINQIVDLLGNETAWTNIQNDMQDRGLAFDPNWIQQHVRPGSTVSPETYGMLQNYALNVGTRDPAAGQVMNNYQMHAGIPNAQRDRIQDWMLHQRAGAINQLAWNPQTGQWETPQNLQEEMLRQQMAAFGMDTISGMNDPVTYESGRGGYTSVGGGDGQGGGGGGARPPYSLQPTAQHGDFHTQMDINDGQRIIGNLLSGRGNPINVVRTEPQQQAAPSGSSVIENPLDLHVSPEELRRLNVPGGVTGEQQGVQPQTDTVTRASAPSYPGDYDQSAQAGIYALAGQIGLQPNQQNMNTLSQLLSLVAGIVEEGGGSPQAIAEANKHLATFDLDWESIQNNYPFLLERLLMSLRRPSVYNEDQVNRVTDSIASRFTTPR